MQCLFSTTAIVKKKNQWKKQNCTFIMRHMMWCPRSTRGHHWGKCNLVLWIKIIATVFNIALLYRINTEHPLVNDSWASESITSYRSCHCIPFSKPAWSFLGSRWCWSISQLLSGKGGVHPGWLTRPSVSFIITVVFSCLYSLCMGVDVSVEGRRRPKGWVGLTFHFLFCLSTYF